MLNPEQKFVYDSVLEAVQDENPNTPKTFCVNAFAGAGKTFLFRTILHAVRGMGHVAVPVAWTGIAAVLLTGGRTVHSTFKLPVPILENSSCHVRQDSAEGRYLKTAKLFIWDECTMTPHYALEAVDRLLRDLTGLDVPFGGKTLVLGGDWRQTLPVIAHGNRTSAIESCLRNSFLWSHFKQCTLSTNMRLHPEEQEFSEWLLQLGDGRLKNDSGLDEDIIEIPSLCVVNRSIVEEMFGCGSEFDLQDLASKAILCPKNEEALKLNEEILSKFPGQVFTLYSADSVICDDEEEQDTYQLDFIHSLTPSGMPPHCLNLKLGVIVMLLRNLNPSAGLCNGTRLIVKRIMQNVLDCEVISGQNAGSRVFIPRVELSPSDSNLPFQLKRRQFPIRLAFCMTINKSQGQTLKKVGIYLPQPVFSHGMLYVAFSRCSSMRNVSVLVKDTKKQGRLIPGCSKVFTRNIVYREVLQLKKKKKKKKKKFLNTVKMKH
ncbi:ATP-dependent DNA helicase pif1-like [Stegodyphus dumicola]|uniref:ATP-dependent DNA helicase pif1-like n=1 Tax=Stegodyphus dumicola TaxID=202533 RepID=UPI0015AC86D5|nr:ATP-dependent DNA helicase pif1-like [Stegodyphus dumicola]